MQPQITSLRPREFFKAKRYTNIYRWGVNELDDFLCDITVPGLISEVKRLKLDLSSKRRADLIQTLYNKYTIKN